MLNNYISHCPCPCISEDALQPLQLSELNRTVCPFAIGQRRRYGNHRNSMMQSSALYCRSTELGTLHAEKQCRRLELQSFVNSCVHGLVASSHNVDLDLLDVRAPLKTTLETNTMRLAPIKQRGPALWKSLALLDASSGTHHNSLIMARQSFAVLCK
jgi:hypothetical protein